MWDRASVVITGASGGIGAALARQLGSRARRLILVARDEQRLRAVADGLACETRVISCDLAQAEARDDLRRTLAGETVDVLVNNAGIGAWGRFAELEEARLRELLAVNVTAPIELTRWLLPAMLSRGRGAILNVGSVNGFQGTPFMAAYGGTKGLLANFTEGLGWELRGTGVIAVLLAPGSTRTDFFASGGVPIEGMLKFMGEPEAVARAGIRALDRRRPCAIPGLLNWLAVASQRFVPRWLVGRVAYRLLRPPPAP
ncbi:MAG: SDR family NAD(P)-dependent oxidoreductase [Planctomycetota bacterium]